MDNHGVTAAILGEKPASGQEPKGRNYTARFKTEMMTNCHLHNDTSTLYSLT